MRTTYLLLAAAMLTACSGRGHNPDDGVMVPGLDSAAHTGGQDGYLVRVGLDRRLPRDFIGCLNETDDCFVLGQLVETELRFEPHTGRYWFLDPGSGNTYYDDGELRTGEPILVAGEAKAASHQSFGSEAGK